MKRVPDRLKEFYMNDPTVNAFLDHWRFTDADFEEILISLVISLSEQKDEYKNQLIHVMQNSPYPIVLKHKDER